MSLLATTDDFESRHGQDDGRVEPLLEDASALILEEVEGSVAEWVTEETPKSVPTAVVATCVEVAFRAWNNPESLSSEALGEYTRAWQNRSGVVFYLTKDEIRRVRRAAGLGTFSEVTLESPYSGEVTNDLLE